LHEKLPNGRLTMRTREGWMDDDCFREAEQEDRQALRALLERGGDVDARGEYGRTALMLAVRGGLLEVVEDLIRRGANPNAAPYYDQNAAAYYGPTAMTCAAVQARGWQVLGGRCWPTHPPDTRYLELLTAAGGRLGLREAILLGDVDLARRVCDSDSTLDINGEAEFGMHETYLMLAADYGPPAMIDFLLDRGADIEGTDDLGWTALIRAAEAGLVCVLERLLDRGAEVKGGPGREALAQAQSHGHPEVVSLLLSRGAKPGDSEDA
jgi:ankyrin repeat-rich membrane spanning protein